MKRLLSATLALVILLGFCTLLPSAEEANEAPSVLPAVTEWTGGFGRFTITEQTNIVIENDSLLSSEKISIINEYFASAFGFKPSIKYGNAGSGDIFIASSDDVTLGDEGYTMEIGEILKIQSPTQKGRMYGVITAIQSQIASGYVPRGSVRDVPYYAVRCCMIDVGRAYLPLDFVEEITKYISWFKLNQIHLHINDSGANQYTAFRLESDVPGLTSTDGFYTKSDYRAYQKRMLEYGVDVVTEIDTPAHSACFAKAVPSGYMLPDGNHIDISNPDAVEFVKTLFDEYITGDDPVFVSKTVHIGTDEYPAGYNEQMRAYTDTLIKHIRSRGYVPRFWGSFGGDGFNGSTEVSSEAQCNYWATQLSDIKVLLEMGYDIINTCGPVLYIVPGGNYGLSDYYNLKAMYESWFVNYLGVGPSSAIAPDHKQLLGASSALWNDLHTDGGGFSVYDIFDRLRGQVCLISEKTWCGEKTKDISADNFMSRYDVFSKQTPSANPGCHYTLPLEGDKLTGVDAVGFPYQAAMTVSVTGTPCDILSGSNGRLYVQSNGKIAFEREGYVFEYAYTVTKGDSFTLRLIADSRQTMLVINDTYVYPPKNTKNASLTHSSTFVLPLKNKGTEGKCAVGDIKITNDGYDLVSHKINGNYAAGCNITVSALEVDYGALNEPLAVDGNRDTRLSFSRFEDVQWMICDLGLERSFSRISIDFFEHIPEYEIYVSKDGKDYTKIYEDKNGVSGVRQTDICDFERVTARYIKYVQLKRYYHKDYYTYYSGGICEFEVFGIYGGNYPDYIKESIAEADSLLDAPDADKKLLADVRTVLSRLSSYLSSGDVYDTHVNALNADLKQAIKNYNPQQAQSEPEPESSAEASGQSEEAGNDNNAIIPVLIGLTVLAIVVSAVIFIKKRKGR